MVNRNYSTVATETTLAGSVSGSATLIQVGSVSGFPATPFTLVLDPDTLYEEAVTVTSAASTTLTVTRGEDGTSGLSHEAGAVVRHMATARDFREPQQHMAASTGVHNVGAGSAVVGTETSQTLSNKTLDASNSVASGALPSDVLFATGSKTVSDKTFDTSNTYQVPTPTASSHATPKSYVDARPRRGRYQDFAPNVTGSLGFTGRYFYTNIPSKDYNRLVTVTTAANISVPSGATWLMKVVVVDQGAPVDSSEGVAIMSVPLVAGSVNSRFGPAMSATFDLSANDSKAVRVWLEKVSGGDLTIYDGAGIAGRVDWVEVSGTNDW